ncbi:MAG: hypothetical protein AAGF31_10290, partial [Planctomycetota bacterium]
MLVCGSLSIADAQPATEQAKYQDASAPIADRVEDLLKRMTLAEKVGQLHQVSAHGGDEQRFLTAAREGRIGSLLNVAFDGVKVDADGVYQEDSSQFFAKDPER